MSSIALHTTAAPAYAYDDTTAASWSDLCSDGQEPADQGRSRPQSIDRGAGCKYDDPLNVARASARSDGYGSAPRVADDVVDLASPARRTHILRGDASGGGHLWPGGAGKTPFPRSWSGDRIMHEISDIATDPTAWRGAIPQGSRTVLTGTRGGVDIRVIVDSRTGEITTGYPTNLVRNAR